MNDRVMVVLGHGNRPGRAMAAALTGAWRSAPPLLEMDESDLGRIAPSLMRTQEAGMVWRRLPPQRRESALGRKLAASFRHVRLRNAVVERVLPSLVNALQDAGVDPMVVKGWSLSRHYGERGLRPYGDVDLAVRAREAAAARRVLDALAPLDVAVDLHVSLTNEQGVRLLEDDEAAVHARSVQVEMGHVRVRVPGWEDALRLVCLHMWRHGAFRPLWLCDVAALVEALPEAFDWELCLGLRHGRSDWVMYAVELARRLLGAQVRGLPACRLPAWLESAVLRQWTEFGEAPPRRLITYLRDPRGFYHKLRWRWTNPLWGAQRWHGPLQRLPRWRWQLREFFTPGTRLIRHIPEIEVCEV